MERWLGMYHEQRIQDWFIGHDLFLRFWNISLRQPALHRHGRRAHLVLSASASSLCRGPQHAGCGHRPRPGGILVLPCMPPRLLDAAGPYGGAGLHDGSYGFVDTLAEVGGLWSFDSGAMQDISNQYAAMPSLHCAWALWCTFVLWALWTRPWQRIVLVLYPIATLFCIVVTANHFWIDGLGGVATLLAGYGVARSIEARWWQRQLDEHDERDAEESDSGDPTGAQAVEVPDEAAL